MYYKTPGEFKVMQKIAVGNKEIVNVRIDSDDMYHRNAISELNTALNNNVNDWFQWIIGYGYQLENPNGRMKVFMPKHKSTPFFAHRHSVGDWLSNKTIIEPQHRQVISKQPVIMLINRILVGVHSRNSSTAWLKSYFKNEISGKNKINILREFGVTE
jgi:hypothetical protein